MQPPVLLVTGFGAFPGAPFNPTADLMRHLAAHETRFARLGIKLERRILPVVYEEIAPSLKSLIDELAPDAVLHFGLAGRRHAISIETRALNRLGVLHPDAAGRRVKDRHVLPSERAFDLRALVPVNRLNAALRRSNIASALSIDAGNYVCNQTFYQSLVMARGTQRAVGFIHVPKLKASVLTQAAVRLILALLPALRREPSHGA